MSDLVYSVECNKCGKAVKVVEDNKLPWIELRLAVDECGECSERVSSLRYEVSELEETIAELREELEHYQDMSYNLEEEMGVREDEYERFKAERQERDEFNLQEIEGLQEQVNNLEEINSSQRYSLRHISVGTNTAEQPRNDTGEQP